MELETLSPAVGQKWSLLWPTVAKLEGNKDVGRALEPEEEKVILEVAAHNPSPLLYPYLMTLAWTGMRDSEGRLSRWDQMRAKRKQKKERAA